MKLRIEYVDGSFFNRGGQAFRAIVLDSDKDTTGCSYTYVKDIMEAKDKKVLAKAVLKAYPAESFEELEICDNTDREVKMPKTAATLAKRIEEGEATGFKRD